MKALTQERKYSIADKQNEESSQDPNLAPWQKELLARKRAKAGEVGYFLTGIYCKYSFKGKAAPEMQQNAAQKTVKTVKPVYKSFLRVEHKDVT